MIDRAKECICTTQSEANTQNQFIRLRPLQTVNRAFTVKPSTSGAAVCWVQLFQVLEFLLSSVHRSWLHDLHFNWQWLILPKLKWTKCNAAILRLAWSYQGITHVMLLTEIWCPDRWGSKCGVMEHNVLFRYIKLVWWLFWWWYNWCRTCFEPNQSWLGKPSFHSWFAANFLVSLVRWYQKSFRSSNKAFSIILMLIKFVSNLFDWRITSLGPWDFLCVLLNCHMQIKSALWAHHVCPSVRFVCMFVLANLWTVWTRFGKMIPYDPAIPKILVKS